MLTNFFETNENWQPQVIAATITSLVAYLDARSDIWIPKDKSAKFKINSLIALWVTINSCLTYFSYPLILPFFENSLALPSWSIAVIAGSSYLLIVKVISFRFKLGESESVEFSLNKALYEKVQRVVFTLINEIVDPYLEKEIELICKGKTKNDLKKQIIRKINRANTKVLDKEQKSRVKKYVNEVYSDDSVDDEEKKELLANILITQSYMKEK